MELLVIQVPQIDSYFAKKHKDEWKMMGLDHVNYFGKKTITQLLKKHGYEVETIKSSWEIKLFIMYTILPLLKRLRGNKKQTLMDKLIMPLRLQKDNNTLIPLLKNHFGN
jgi:hypothetical protein